MVLTSLLVLISTLCFFPTSFFTKICEVINYILKTEAKRRNQRESVRQEESTGMKNVQELFSNKDYFCQNANLNSFNSNVLVLFIEMSSD